jgi:hypothetical protein
MQLLLEPSRRKSLQMVGWRAAVNKAVPGSLRAVLPPLTWRWVSLWRSHT